ncbi:MAG: glucose/arabinose dehydrogenase [Limisphaerales bacterium]|jgi:glucose/arabinose dehydrogenase
MNKLTPVFLLATIIGLHSQAAQGSERISLPDGFRIQTLDFSVPNARQIALTADGTLIVGTRREGVVYAVTNALSDKPGKPLKIAKDLTMPSGVAVHKGDLYIGATHQILKIENIDQNLNKPTLEVIADDLPTKRHHGWKYIKFGPDGQLYVPVGAPCNICLSDDPRFASLLTMNPETGQSHIWAEGLRNTVGFAWHPQRQDLWITDNGRDMLGEDIPGEELNVANAKGLHFGYPFVHAGDIDDPEFGDHKARLDKTFTEPQLKIQAHSAALGMTFYTGSQFPKNYDGALFIAEHGSWNRANKVGYKVSVVTEQDGELVYQPFAEGWLVGEDNWGRPNDVLQTAEGALLISDDQAGAIYKITYEPNL